MIDHNEQIHMLTQRLLNTCKDFEREQGLEPHSPATHFILMQGLSRAFASFVSVFGSAFALSALAVIARQLSTLAYRGPLDEETKTRSRTRKRKAVNVIDIKEAARRLRDLP